MTTGTEQFFEAWKRQVETSVHIMDALVEASARMRSAQFTAANETHERTQALQKALADAKNAQELWGAQWNWALACCERSAAYWRSLFETMNESNGRMACCMRDGAGASVPAQASHEVPASGYAAMDNAYREMLERSRQLLQYTASAFGTPAPPAAANPLAKEEAKQSA